ncbi:MAG: DNA mismatch repair endonuclease MutL, partial [Hymenobacteraceae bacterium]|nr:DNA mismatch repair endonuclease MutL [Hymenobacteraceae bacterium]MDX5396983.1 DNA mismatch repair endonuclease MutL [Hymenobacteraceae bacterium]MDX5442784.1 DNA mismatch repair endonuclease MutL [Hymenobacteraceae bacterium]MDX5513057.1 DNA mismatch repair endonuclease MutL [Hymenobacteraceae bacterium]
MADIIHLLPDYLANQIAAGEVVQRPASVVKELLENAIDAKATQIQLLVKEAGKQLIQVTDNGVGMSETDARMSFERHATSKIKNTEDLFRIRTMGFRGEALASIAAVAQVELKTKTQNSETGTRLVVEASEVVLQEPVAAPDGTSFVVKNLFYNVPARRNFLKTNAVEMRHILDEFQRVALANPEVAFTLYHNDVEVFNLPAGKLSQRIVSLFGNNYKEQLALCEEDASFVRIRGYIGKPEYAKKTRGEQFFFVNNRFIKSAYLNHALLTAYEGLLPKESFPFYVLFIDIAPEQIDINVHPTKTEIKFEDEKAVYAVVRAAVRQSLGLHNIAPSLDFEQDVNFAPLQPIRTMPETNSFERAEARPAAGFNGSRSKPGNTQNWEMLYEPVRQERQVVSSRASSLPDSVEFGDQPETLLQNATQKTNTKTLQVHQKYLMVQVKSGVMLVDQQAAQERILYEKYSMALQKKNATSQQLLFPQTIQFSPMDYVLVQELAEEFTALGFQFSDFGANTIIVNGIPADVPNSNEKELFEGLIEQFKQNRTDMKLEMKENLARAMAKRVAARLTGRLNDVE